MVGGILARSPSFPVCLLHQQQQTFLPEPILPIFPSDLPRRGNNRQKQDLENWNIREKLSESEWLDFLLPPSDVNLPFNWQ